MPPFLAAVSDGTEPLTGWATAWVMVVLAIAPLALMVSGYLGARGRIRPNMVVGIRTAYTLSDDDAWYAVHFRSAPWTIASGVVMALAIVLFPFLDDVRLQLAAILVPTAAGLVVLCLGVWRTQKVVRARAASDAS
ncbi:SdpI family protein [Nocardiopsis halotolerans]|uniref:SdpI family protein n=1 Tax=Nocardiopsis halotolerans TaxID=124252 RepID=UPI00034B8F44|nr:SdpI family protein [Nocardiopsis halotolerans]